MPNKILVVDDEPDLELLIRQKFRKKIQARDLDFVFAGNGLQALETGFKLTEKSTSCSPTSTCRRWMA